MKRIVLLIGILYVCTACTDLYSGKRPYDYNEGKWISESPQAWFNTGKTYENQPLNMPVGEITINGEAIPFILVFDSSLMVALCNYDISNTNFDYSFEDSFIEGKCIFSETELKIKITTADEDIDLNFDEIIFVKDGNINT